jgi:hypothetical protein
MHLLASAPRFLFVDTDGLCGHVCSSRDVAALLALIDDDRPGGDSFAAAQGEVWTVSGAVSSLEAVRLVKGLAGRRASAAFAPTEAR